jgi:hypothetical protein
MKTFKKFILESINFDILPNEPGTVKIPNGHIRLYHQTREENIEQIKKNGIDIQHAKGIEGPKAIYADESGFYGNPKDTYSIEFSVPKENFSSPFVIGYSVIKPENFIAIHEPWHQHARYFINNNLIEEVKNGEYDYVAKNKNYKKAIDFIRNNY